MFCRILAYTAARNLYKFPGQIFVTQQHAVAARVNASSYGVRLLHVKVYDKDLEVQREANRRRQHLEEPNEKFETFAENATQSELKFAKSHQSSSTIDDKEIAIDPDVFGNAPKEPLPEDEGDKAEEEYISRPTRRSKKLRTKEYAAMIKEHLKNHRVKDALEVLEVRMLKEDRVKPENYIYNLLISGCAKAGYTRKAFQLYTKMRQRGLKVKESTYTSLFNACANAPSRLDGLTTANRLREKLLEKGYEPNVKNYNAMLKAFGRWGDIETVYLLADEMVDKKLEMNGETYNFLLQACASDTKMGFRHCLLTWHKMLRKGIQPDYYSFNAVLRCARDCGFGELDSMEEALKGILEGSQQPIKISSSTTHAPQLESGDCSQNNAKSTPNDLVNENIAPRTLQIQTEATSLELPNLLAPQPHLGSMVSLAEVQKPHERFLLLGGLQGFLELMKSYHITPDIETFTTMLEVIPPTNTAEKQLLTYIRKIGLKADIDFFNILIKKRAMRFDYEGGKEVLSMIRTAGLYPDIVTYGVLALGCTTVESSRELLQKMQQNNIRMNMQILGAMLRQGCAKKDFSYICEIIQISLDENIKPNDIFLRHLHKFHLDCARAIDARHPTTKTQLYKKSHKKFCDKYRLYLEEHSLANLKLDDQIKKIRERPYEHYKETPVDGMEPLKNEKLASKQKLRKYIKKIKIQHLKGDEDDTPQLESVQEDSTQKSIDKPKVTNVNNPFRVT
ncbi:pentatricopeptide repeat-containing protein 1, mitochondrial [Musca vetustissima]|uniref:pentatricopeptide repeat-containing protein 1, mitochondrial n=1 Tax=Musca vetustissima TaxID=27455 RepID=UPI002AB7E858|nr:pentatricopeptide repeat-containing protein 1, mitochondrial [Musca vetustissima]